jgi:muramoyltetrapeptide carboxypeptidase
MIRVGIVAPARRLNESSDQAIRALVATTDLPIELVIHPQCADSFGHFAGPDDVRLEAFLGMANDPSIDAIWFARGGYGAARLLSGLEGRLGAAARTKVYLGYSDMGFLFAGLTQSGCNFCAHGPLVGDIERADGQQAALRALRFLARQGGTDLDARLDVAAPNIAFNLTVLRSLIGTPWLAGFQEGSILALEDVAEYTYATDRSMFQLTSADWFKDNVKGVRIGRFSAIPDNEIAFHQSSEEAVAHWCAQAGVPIVGNADIGHDIHNKIVPFGKLSDWRAAGLID